MAKAIFITRAQPFHLGHLHAVQEAMKKFDEVVIGIGSSNESNTWRNPFSFEERKEMIEMTGVKCKIIGIPDIGNDEEWCKNVIKMEKFDVVVTGSDMVTRCFSGTKEVMKPSFLLPEIYNGIRIREKIVKSEEWEDLVPKNVAEYIKKIDGVRRIKELAERELEF